MNRSSWLCLFLLAPASTMQGQSTPPAPTSNIPWSGSGTGVVLIASAFGNARVAENAQLGLSMPTTATMPDQAAWEGMTTSEKALWLINGERVVRGLLPFEGVDANVLGVVQAYAETLGVKGVLSHSADGTSFTQRLNAKPSLNGHYTYAGENLFWSGSSSIGVERAVYMWLYEDATASWLHRASCLYGPMANNHGDASSEGLMGVGRGAGPSPGVYYVYNVVDPTADYLVAIGELRGTIPPTFVLDQNYPNPFNPTTTIRFGLPERAAVTLALYNSLGQMVAILLDGECEAGYHDVRFDGRGLSTGVYLYRLAVGGTAQGRKLLILR